MGKTIGRQPDIRLTVEERDGALYFNANGTHPFPPHPLKRRLRDYFENLFNAIDEMAKDAGLGSVAAAEKLARQGDQLFEEVFPKALQRYLWERRLAAKSLQIVSDIPYIPWELCKLQGREDGRVQDDGFLCEAFEMTRWLPGGDAPQSFAMSRLAVVARKKKCPTTVRAEVDGLLKRARPGRRVERVGARLHHLHDRLADGEYDAWHFAGHAELDGGPDGPAGRMELEDGLFEPGQITSRIKNFAITRPLVVFNSCFSGRAGEALTRPGGWAFRTVGAGAGAFIGTLWAVEDAAASEFARVFYDAFLNGVPLGEAVHRARLAIRERGDASWLAYTAYGDPLARVRPDASLSARWRDLKERAGVAWEPVAKPLLVALCLAREPVSVGVLAAFAGVADPAAAERSLADWRSFLEVDAGFDAPRYAMADEAWRAFVLGLDGDPDEGVDIKAAHARVAAVLAPHRTGQS